MLTLEYLGKLLSSGPHKNSYSDTTMINTLFTPWRCNTDVKILSSSVKVSTYNHISTTHYALPLRVHLNPLAEQRHKHNVTLNVTRSSNKLSSQVDNLGSYKKQSTIISYSSNSSWWPGTRNIYYYIRTDIHELSITVYTTESAMNTVIILGVLLLFLHGAIEGNNCYMHEIAYHYLNFLHHQLPQSVTPLS